MKSKLKLIALAVAIGWGVPIAIALLSMMLVPTSAQQGALYAPFQFLAGPSSAGPNAFANPRAIVGADLPNSISPNNGTLGITNGGTGAATNSAAFNALAATPTRVGDLLYWNGLTWVTVAGNNSGTQFLQETSGGTPSWSSPSGAGTVTSVTIISGNGLGMTGTCTSTSVISCTISPVFLPQGRLTLTTGTPVLKTNVTNVSTIYYDCYRGGKFVSVYNGTLDVTLPIPSCELLDTVPTSSTGVANASGVFDEWAYNNSGTLGICHATNGSGGGWASDTGGSNTARGTGYSQLDTSTRPFITNVNSITHCYTGATDHGPISANQATLLGSFYTTGAGTTSMQFSTSAAGGGNGVLGLSNAYNREMVRAIEQDSNTSWTISSTTWGHADGNVNNSISYLDTTGQSSVNAVYNVGIFADAAGSSGMYCGVQANWSSGTPSGIIGIYWIDDAETSGSALCSNVVQPLLGFNAINALEASENNTTAVTAKDFSVPNQGLTIEVMM